MARRKKDYLSDGSSDSGASGSEDGDGYDPREDPDVREERELFKNARKKRRVGEGKQAAWEGIFGEEEEDVPERRRSRGGRGGGPSRGSARFTWVA
jgi:tuftelin-interacting protein 11